MAICPKMNGAICPESHCDMWDMSERRCLYAVEKEKKVELLSILIERLLDTGDKKEVSEVLNVALYSGVLH